MNYPLISEYIDAIKTAEDNFEELKNLRPVLDDDGQPVMSSGNFAVVFKMTDGKKNYAVKCFTKAQDGRDSAYKLISEELEKVQSPYILKVRYLENELFVDTSQSEETEFPVLVMDWVEGQTLSSFLQHIANNYDEDYSFWSEEDEKTALFELKCLPYNFIRAASWLIKQPFAHGDIKPDNIIIKPNGTCVLVDYDGMYVPAMQGMKMQCMGTPNYRYPSVKEQRFDNSLDNYSISIIALSLCAFALEPQRVCDCDDFCIIAEKDTSRLHEHNLFIDEVLMSNHLFRDLLAIYLHTLSQNKLDPNYYDSCISEYLCPSNYDIKNTAITKSDKEDYWEDIWGVRYSLDGRKVICASKELKGVDYTIREGVLTVCDQAFQSKALHSITLPYSVLAIGDRAFANNDDMEFCNIPPSVKYIYGNNPWGGCFKIKKMECFSPSYNIMDGVLYSSDFNIVYGLIYWHSKISIDQRAKKICSNAFWSSRKEYNYFLKEIELPNISKIGSGAFDMCKGAFFHISDTLEDISKEAFSFCESIETINIKNVHAISESAFCYCKNLKEIVLSPDLEFVNKNAFKGCTSITKFDFSKNLHYIDFSSFFGCISLREINVDLNNEHYTSVNGVLFNKSITKLIKYPAGKTSIEYEIPDSVCEIEDEAFADCVSIERIFCKNAIYRFGINVFKNCSNLKYCFITLSDNTDKGSAWNLGSFLFPLKNAEAEMKKNGFDLIVKAATLGHPYAQWYLAKCYKFGWNGEKDMQNYLIWLERSALNENYEAMSQFGKELLLGKNISTDYERAYSLYSKLEEAASDAECDCKGNFYAPLGLFYENGLVVPKDTKKAVEYYKNGSEWNDSIAEFSLGRCYENGIGVEIDLKKARDYYSSAKEHKHKGAIEALERVEKLLNTSTNVVEDDLPF